MILHYEEGENLCAIYNTGKTGTMAYNLFHCFLFSVLGSKQPRTTEFQVRMKIHFSAEFQLLHMCNQLHIFNLVPCDLYKNVISLPLIYRRQD